MDERQKEDLVSIIRELISRSDLETCSTKAIISELQSRLGHTVEEEELLFVKESIDNILSEKLLEAEDAKLAAQLHREELNAGKITRSQRKRPAPRLRPTIAKSTSKKRAVNPFNRELILSPALSALLDGVTKMSRPAVVKKIWEYVKARDLQDPKNKKIIICDEKLESVFKKKRVDCFGMNRLLSNHLGAPDEISGSTDASSIGDNDDNDNLSDDQDADDNENDSSGDKGEDRKRKWIKVLQPLSLDLPENASHRHVQQACMDYVKQHGLFNASDPTVIHLDENIRKCIGLAEGRGSSMSLLDFIDSIRSFYGPEQL